MIDKPTEAMCQRKVSLLAASNILCSSADRPAGDPDETNGAGDPTDCAFVAVIALQSKWLMDALNIFDAIWQPATYVLT